MKRFLIILAFVLCFLAACWDIDYVAHDQTVSVK
jgi:hypothetical protein